MTFPFDARYRLIIVRAEIWGPAGSAVLRLALDTGATGTMINTALLVAVGYDPALATDRVEVTTGSTIEYVSRLILSRIATLGKDRSEFPVLAHTLPPSAGVDGLLGLDFFRGQRLFIDFRAGSIELD
jgi:predicted aspartyl protease